MSVATLQDALAAEHAAIYAYGLLGAFLTGRALALAAEAENEHRDRRDTAATLLAGAGATPDPAAPAYSPTGAVTSYATAVTAALGVEERCAMAWRATLADSGKPERTLAVDALAACAVTAARWRRRARPSAPSTVPFPGA